MPGILTKIKSGLTNFFTPQPPENPDLGVFQGLFEREQAEGREFSLPEIQRLMEWDDVAMAAAAPHLGIARAVWRRYQEKLAAYQQKRQKTPASTPVPATAPPPAPASDDEDITVPGITLDQIIAPAGRSFSDMTADELSARRRAILANTPFDLPLHRKFMNVVKETWRVVGPVAFVVFTVWEVYYFMNHFLQVSNLFDVVLLWGISLIIEIPFMIATYDQSERRERAAERRARGEDDTIPGKVGSLIFWCVLAAVNVAGQIAFLAFVTKAGYSLTDPASIGLWGFILLRVSGVIVGDCYTAFHLLPTEANIDRVLRAQKAQTDGEKRLSESDAERLRKDAESQRTIRRIQLSVQRDEREAQFIEDWQRMNMDQTLERQRHFVELEQRNLRQLSGGQKIEELDEPDRGDL